MRIAFVADVHVGNHKKHGGEFVAGMNKRCRGVLATLERAAAVAKQHKAEALVVCGDTFDTAKPTPQMIRGVQRAVKDAHAIFLVGNHDRLSDVPGDHALGPLKPVGAVVEKPTAIELSEGWTLLAIPYMPGAATEWFEQAVATAVTGHERGGNKLLAFHLGVEDETTAKFLKGAHDSVPMTLVADIMKKHGIRYAFAGNWHDHRQWTIHDGLRGIVQCGTLAPTGWDNGGLDGYGNVVIFDSERDPFVRMVEVPGPRFVTVNGPRAVDTVIASARKEGHSVFARWQASPDDFIEAKEEIEEWISAGLIESGHAERDDAGAEEAAREVAKATGKAETLEEAVATYVESMPLKEGVNRQDVLESVRGYLR